MHIRTHFCITGSDCVDIAKGVSLEMCLGMIMRLHISKQQPYLLTFSGNSHT